MEDNSCVQSEPPQEMACLLMRQYHHSAERPSDEGFRQGSPDLIDTESQKKSKKFKMKFLYSSLFATILENALMQLKILENCNNHLYILATQCDLKHLRAEKFGVAHVPIEDELEGVDRKQFDKEDYKLKKLALDRQIFQETLFMTYADLGKNGSFKSLLQHIAILHDRDAHLNTLIAEEANNKVILRDLIKQVRQQRNHILTANYDVDNVIDKLKARMEDAVVEAECRSRYIMRWQMARAEQHKVAISETEAVPLADLTEYKHRLEGEHRVHIDVMTIISMKINETIDKVEQAMTKYDNDMEAVDLKIQIMKNNYETQIELRKEIQEKIKSQENEMSEWVSFKACREEARLYREKMIRAATAAQAWWRGILVRQQLGPYKPSKTKRAPAKPKN